ncbi:hypothetical protein GEMRC1_001504 [Eukaryota sp. GEM-RC1]
MDLSSPSNPPPSPPQWSSDDESGSTSLSFPQFDQSLVDAISQAQRELSAPLSFNSSSTSSTPSRETTSRLSSRQSTAKLRSSNLQLSNTCLPDHSFDGPEFSPVQPFQQLLSTISDNNSFYQRNIKWTQRRSKFIDDQKRINEEESLSGCTFTPRVNRKDSSSLRHSDDVIRRLESASERRQASLMESMTRISGEEYGSCTFAPKINEKSRQLSQRTRIKKQSVIVDSAEPPNTFKPNVNPLSTDNSLVQSYLSRDAFERLYNVVKEVKKVIDLDTFLHRQQCFERKKLSSTRRAEVLANSQRQAKPSLCPKSREIMSSRKDVPIFERKRQKKNVLKNEGQAARSVVLNMSEEELANQIARKNKLFLEKKQKNIQKIKRMEEQKASKQLTFKPEIKSIDGQSKLRLSNDGLSNYIPRMSDSMKQKEVKLLSISKQLEEKEMRDCTFKPKTTPLPRNVFEISRRLQK